MKQVSRIVRRFRLSGDELTNEMDIAWSGSPCECHLTSTLRRAGVSASRSSPCNAGRP
jgi:hypothetical protein